MFLKARAKGKGDKKKIGKTEMAIVIGDEIKGFNPTSADRKAGWKEGWKAFPIREVRVFPLFHLQGGQPSPLSCAPS